MGFSLFLFLLSLSSDGTNGSSRVPKEGGKRVRTAISMHHGTLRFEGVTLVLLDLRTRGDGQDQPKWTSQDGDLLQTRTRQPLLKAAICWKTAAINMQLSKD